jgi:transcriptional regulator with XRE-family HTH domain
MEKPLLILGANIRRVRQSHKLSQEAMADVCGLHRTYICDIERGARNVTVGSLLKIARGLGTTISELTRDLESDLIQRAEKSVGNSGLTEGNPRTAVRRALDGSTTPLVGL